MGIIAPTLPTPGDPRGQEEGDVRNTLQALVSLVNGGLDGANIADGSIGLSELAASLQNLFVKPGMVGATAADTPDSGYLLCDGAAVSRTTYAALFARIGTKFNTGGESGTDFRLPDYVGRVLVMKGTHADIDNLADNDGLAVASRRPKHLHDNPNTDFADLVIGGPSGTTNVAGPGTPGAEVLAVASAGHNHADNPHVHPIPDTAIAGPAYGVCNYQIKT